jgi:hypothetical protein
MEKSNKRGKIPQSDWPLIMARYEAGETLASIARTYDCSPPAISYIVSRSRERPASEASPPVSEPQLLKAPVPAKEPAATEAPASVAAPAPVAPPVPAAARGEAAVEPRAAVPNGSAQRDGGTERERAIPAASRPTAAAPNGAGEQRRTLHLSLGNGNGHANGHTAGNGGGNGHDPQLAAERSRQPQPPIFAKAVTQNGAAERPPAPFEPPPRPAPVSNGSYGRQYAENGRVTPPVPRDGDGARGRDGSSFIDHELRSRVDGDIAAFLAAFDAALAADTQESRFGLREATDRLLRAGARTRIELERLEARVPLPQG